VKRFASAALASFACACGLVDGVKARPDEPGSSSTGLATLSWHGPERIDQGVPSQSDAPRISWGGGQLWVVFTEYLPSTQLFHSWIETRGADRDFDLPVQVPAPAGWDEGQAIADIAVNANGAAVVAFQADTHPDAGTSGLTSSIWAAKYQGSTASFSGSARLDSPGSSAPQLGNQSRPVAIDDSGDAVVAWAGNLGAGGIFSSASAAQGSWSSPNEIQTGGAYGIDLVAGATGNAWIAWTQGMTKSTYATTIGIANGSNSAGPLAPLNTDATSSATVIAARGAMAIAVAPIANGLLTSVYQSGAWQPQQTISDTDMSVYVEPAVAINSSGQAVLIWRDRSVGDSYAGTEQAAFFDGRSWSTKQTISLPHGNVRAWWAQVAMTDSGSALAAWADLDPTDTFTRIYADVLEIDGGVGTWQGAKPVDQASPDAGLAGQPENVRWVGVALDPAGSTASVVWMQHDNDASSTPHAWANWLGK
jgi:hypothetical protein